MITRFTCSTISEAPASPGLYAWYSKVDVGESDYLRLILDGKDEGEARFRALLARHTKRHNLPDLHVQIRSSFESEWKAHCAELTTERFIQTLYGSGESEAPDQATHERPDLFDKAFTNQKSRLLLKQLLEDSVPIFAAPVYIGVTDDLRRRLGEHVKLLQRLARALEKTPERAEALRRAATSPEFAARALAAGFDENYLEVHVQDLTGFATESFTPDQLRDIAGSAEWILNRWHKPYLGRR